MKIEKCNKRSNQKGERIVIRQTHRFKGRSEIKNGKTFIRKYLFCHFCEHTYSSRHYKEHLRTHKLSAEEINLYARASGKPDNCKLAICNLCKKAVKHLNAHRYKFHQHDKGNVEDSSPPQASDNVLKSALLSRIQAKYNVETINTETRFSYEFTKSEEQWRERLISHTSFWLSDNRKMGAKALAHHNRVAMRRHTQLSYAMGRCVGVTEMVDPDLFEYVEYRRPGDGTKGLQWNSLNTLCSEVITFIRGIIFVRRKIPGTPCDLFFNTLSIDELNAAITTINDLKNEAARSSRAEKGQKQVLKSLNLPSEKDYLSLWNAMTSLLKEKAKESTFVSVRNIILTTLLAFNPVRVEPFESLTIHDVFNPIAVKNDTIFVMAGKEGGQFKGHHKAASKGLVVFSLTKEFHEILKKFINSFVDPLVSNQAHSHVFCTLDGSPLKCISSTVAQTSLKFLGKAWSSNDYRSAVTNIWRDSGKNAKKMSLALYHSEKMADDEYASKLNTATAEFQTLVLSNQNDTAHCMDTGQRSGENDSDEENTNSRDDDQSGADSDSISADDTDDSIRAGDLYNSTSDADPNDSNRGNDLDDLVSENDSDNSAAFHGEPLKVTIGTFVIVKFDSDWYLGRVDKMTKNDRFLINCLEYVGHSRFKWPSKKDCTWYTKKEIMLFDVIVRQESKFYIFHETLFPSIDMLL